MPLLELIPWDRCCLILWILRMVYCSWMVASHYNCTGLTLLCRVVFSLLAIVRYHHTRKQCFIAPCAQWAAGPISSSSLLEGLTLFADNTGLVVGRTIVDPSKWSVPELQPGDCYGQTFLRGWHSGTDIGHASLSRNHTVERHAVMIRCPHIYKN